MALNPRNTLTLKQRLLHTHELWQNNIRRWQFLIDSYHGGQDYRDGKYLTAYQMESQEEYESRLDSTPYDNHVKAITSIFNSFLFRKPPTREMGSLENDPGLDGFMKDADLDGRSFDVIMKEISTYAAVYGHVYCLLDKPPVNSLTRAEELSQGIRPYISIITPENVLDWRYERSLSGVYYMTYLKIFEGNKSGDDIFREYTSDSVKIYAMGKSEEPILVSELPNQLGRVPAICVYGQRSPNKGVGISLVGDVADMCRAIYNEYSEIEALGRLTNHPSLVKDVQTQASAGAGSIIQVPSDAGPDFVKPYLLQPDGASLDGFLKSIEAKIGAIDRMAHMGGIRSIETRRLSGIGLATEFQLLNATLAALADNLEHAEEQIWRLYAAWQDTVWDGEINYPDSFNIQDKYNDMNMLKLAKDAAPKANILHKVIEEQMLKLLANDEYQEYEEILDAEYNVEQNEVESDMSEQSTDRLYPDGQPIPDDLPPAYQSSASDGVPEGQACGNCQYNVDQRCTKFNNAPIRESWWCKVWEPNQQ